MRVVFETLFANGTATRFIVALVVFLAAANHMTPPTPGHQQR